MILSFYCHCFHTTPSSLSPWDGVWPQLIVGIISSILGFGTAYLIFILGQQKEREKLVEAEEKELKDFLTFVKLSCQRVIEPAQRQADSIKSLLSQLEEKKVVDLKLSDVSSFNLKWFESIDKIKTQKAFFRTCPGTIEEKTELYSELLGAIDLMDITKKMLRGDFEFTLNTGLQFEKVFNHGREGILKIYDDIRVKYRAVGQKEDALSDYEKVMVNVAKDWYSIKEPERLDMFISWEKFLSKNELAEIALTYNKPQMLDFLRECSFGYNSYIKNQEFAKFKFSNHLQNLEESIKKVNNVIRNL